MPRLTPTSFHRYSGTENDTPDTNVRMPTNILDSRVSNLCITELIGRFESFMNDPKCGPSAYPWATRFAMGFALPEWQRPLVWTEIQKVNFINSIWSGVDVGSYMVNDQYEFIKGSNAGKYRLHSEVLLDGQQRLSAIQSYLLNEFPTNDSNGNPRFWNELPRIERRRFSGFHFARANIKSWDEDKLRLAYDLRSFGGTAHTEDHRASKRLNNEIQRPRG